MFKFNLIALFLFFSFSLSAQSTLIRGESVFFDNQNFAQAKTDNDGASPYFYRYGHFSKIPTSKERTRLEAHGVTFVNYFENLTYLLAFRNPVSKELCKSIGMDGLVSVSPPSKLSQKIKERPIPEWAMAKNGFVKIIVKGYETSTPTDFKDLFEQLNIELDFAGRRQQYVEITVPEEKIEYLATLPEVSFIDWINPPAVMDDDIGRGMHRSNVLSSNYPGGRNYDGDGVKVLVRDDGNVGPHIDFEGRINQIGPALDDGEEHGDMVAGILAGAGNIEPTFKGMATGASLYVRDYNSNFQTYTMDLHQNENVLVTSSSYSNGCNTGYTALTNTIDQQIYENQSLIHIFSAGNTGTHDCDYGVTGWGNITGGHKQGKNAIATGNLNKNTTLRLSSSRGPAYDGRIKPDICAHGHLQMSTDPNNVYGTGGGTSAAAPGAAGVFAQLIHAYKSLNGGADPKSGLIKACLLNTAIDLGNVGPDYQFGWGEINGYRAVKTLENNDYLVSSVDQGQNNTHNITVAAGMTQVRFMLYWMDPPAPANAATALINNLDLKVVSPAGDTILPWVLDPTPNVTTLDFPATHGVDDLNNMEQVVFQAPVAGIYQILVNGKSIPMGPQEYFVLHSAVDEPLFMAFPVGGESFAPGEEVRVFWDAYNVSSSPFIVEASLNNGNSWFQLTSTTEHTYLMTVPNSVTAKGLIRVSRDGHSAQSISNFSILGRPQNINVDTVCANQLYISWDAVTGATDYDLFFLGQKYMDSVGTTTNTGIYVPITDPYAGFWYSVRAKGPNGVLSERAFAKYYAGGLLYCQSAYDIAILDLVDITGEDINQCAAQYLPIKATIKNIGFSPLTDISIVYTKNNGSPITVPYVGSISSGETIIWEAMDSILLDQNGQYSISVNILQNDDEIIANNSLNYSFNVNNIALSTIIDITEGFEGAVFPPSNWNLIDDGDGYAWSENNNIIGIDDVLTNVVWVDNYSFDRNGEVVSIETEAVHADNVVNMVLSFDYAYAVYSELNADTLEILVYDVCGQTQGVQQLFYKGGEDLRTIPSAAPNLWQPESGDDWKHIELIIDGFQGGSIKTRFNNINEYGNSLYLDNIQIQPQSIVGIVAEMSTCVGESVTFTTDVLGDNLSYDWDFDDGNGNVYTQGPHQINYTTAGQKNVQLSVTGPNGTTSYSTSVTINPLPMANFVSTNTSNVAIFTSTSTNADTYSWDFGDGGSSTDMDANHVFLDTGSYTVCLIVGNSCGINSTCQLVNIITDVNEVQSVFPGVQLTPNPATDFLYLSNLGKQAYSFEYSMMDMTGKILQAQSLGRLRVGEQVSMDITHLPSGLYWIKLVSANQIAYAKIIID